MSPLAVWNKLCCALTVFLTLATKEKRLWSLLPDLRFDVALGDQKIQESSPVSGTFSPKSRQIRTTHISTALHRRFSRVFTACISISHEIVTSCALRFPMTEVRPCGPVITFPTGAQQYSSLDPSAGPWQYQTQQTHHNNTFYLTGIFREAYNITTRYTNMQPNTYTPNTIEEIAAFAAKATRSDLLELKQQWILASETIAQAEKTYLYQGIQFRKSFTMLPSAIMY